jgi:hypothetical protein
LFVTVSRLSLPLMLVFGGFTANTGATFTSVTVTAKLFVTLTTPSLTTVVQRVRARPLRLRPAST